MAKRRAGSQLTKENCEDEDYEEESGEFLKADEQELSNRVIRTAKRRSTNTSSPLTGFPGFASTSTSNNSPFSFLNKSSTTNDHTTQSELLKSLNLSFAKWIQQHLDKNPYVVLLPVLKDYEKHFSSLKLDPASNAAPFGSEKSTTITSVLPTQPPKPGLHTMNFFSVPPSSAPPKPGAGLFNFGSNDATKENTAKPCLLNPSFGFSSNLEPTKTTGFQFEVSSSKSLFNSKEVTNANVEAEPNNGDASDEPPNFDFVAPGEEGSTFEMRCKVFLKKDGSFAAIGVGTLFLKPVAGGKTQLITRADTSQGSVLLNLILSSDMPLQKNGKNNLLLVCVPTPESEPPPVPVLIRVKSEEQRDKLLNEMERLKSS